jgi:hypothetical protein
MHLIAKRNKDSSVYQQNGKLVIMHTSKKKEEEEEGGVFLFLSHLSMYDVDLHTKTHKQQEKEINPIRAG